MTETQIGGLIGLFTALPGVVFGLALLLRKWRPGSPDRPGDPEAVRVGAGRLLLAINGLIAVLSVLLLVLPRQAVLPLVPWSIGAIALVTVVGLIVLFVSVRRPR